MSISKSESLDQNSIQQRVLIGKVVSNKMNKTVVVLVERRKKHPIYGKYISTYSKMVAHDEDNACNEGDLVKIQQSKPLSRTKRWKLLEILKKEEQQNN